MRTSRDEVIERMAVSLRQLNKTHEAAALYEDALNADPVAAYAEGAARWSIEAGLLDQARKHIDALSMIDPNAKELASLEARLKRKSDGATRHGG